MCWRRGISGISSFLLPEPNMRPTVKAPRCSDDRDGWLIARGGDHPESLSCLHYGCAPLGLFSIYRAENQAWVVATHAWCRLTLGICQHFQWIFYTCCPRCTPRSCPSTEQCSKCWLKFSNKLLDLIVRLMSSSARMCYDSTDTGAPWVQSQSKTVILERQSSSHRAALLTFVLYLCFLTIMKERDVWVTLLAVLLFHLFCSHPKHASLSSEVLEDTLSNTSRGTSHHFPLLAFCITTAPESLWQHRALGRGHGGQCWHTRTVVLEQGPLSPEAEKCSFNAHLGPLPLDPPTSHFAKCF